MAEGARSMRGDRRKGWGRGGRMRLVCVGVRRAMAVGVGVRMSGAMTSTVGTAGCVMEGVVVVGVRMSV